MTTQTPLAIVTLAAGKGTRMKSDLHKVLHPIAGRPMLQHLLASAAELSPERQVVVAGHGREQLEAALSESAAIAVQEPQLGTAHAVQQAEGALAGFSGDVLILEHNPTARRSEHAGQTVEKRRLAGSVRADDRQQLAGADGEGDVVQDRRPVGKRRFQPYSRLSRTLRCGNSRCCWNT